MRANDTLSLLHTAHWTAADVYGFDSFASGWTQCSDLDMKDCLRPSSKFLNCVPLSLCADRSYQSGLQKSKEFSCNTFLSDIFLKQGSFKKNESNTHIAKHMFIHVLSRYASVILLARRHISEKFFLMGDSCRTKVPILNF